MHYLTNAGSGAPCPSPDGQHIAVLTSTHLEIRETSSLQLVQSVATSAQSSVIRWSPVCEGIEASTRVVLADENNARVCDVSERSWVATINNGSGGMGKIANTEFGRTKNEL